MNIPTPRGIVGDVHSLAAEPDAREGGMPMSGKVHLAPEDGLFELPGPEPVWIWAHTCPTPRCPCRTALVASTKDGRDVLLDRGGPIRDAWNDGTSYAKAAKEAEGLLVFSVNIDNAEVCAVDSRERINLEAQPDVRAVVGRIDGDLLDAFGRLWLKGKGLPDPEQEALLAQSIVIHGWRPGDMVHWTDLLQGVRDDLYLLDDRVYEASDAYCPVPECDCGEVFIAFNTVRPRGGPSAGSVTLFRQGPPKFEPCKVRRERLEELWTAFLARHPRHTERFARRYDVVKKLGSRMVARSVAPAPVVAASKVGRNDPCPCGSGKKSKKCCMGKV
jgi:SEC-C motif